MARATLAQVAERAGVSLATASKVFNGRRDVAQDTRQRVRRAAREVGYQSPARPHTATIRVIVEDFGNPYVPLVMDGLLLEAEDQGFDAIVARSRMSRGLPAHVPTQPPDAIIFVALPVSPEYTSHWDHLGVPVVAIDPRTTPPLGVPVVAATNEAGAQEAAQHLLELGHRRIAAIGGPPDSLPSNERLTGLRRALADAHLRFDPSMVVASDFRFEGGLVAANQLLRHDPAPTAIFAFNDRMARGAMEAAGRLGLRLPRDLSMVGFDDGDTVRWSDPPLTTVRQPLDDMGRTAVRTVAAALRGDHTPPGRLPTRLIVRASTAAPTARA